MINEDENGTSIKRNDKSPPAVSPSLIWEEIPDDQLDGPQTTDIGTLERAPKFKPYNPNEALDEARIRVAMWLLRVLVLVIILNTTLLATGKFTGISFNDVRAVFETMFVSMVTLVSAATGFYFGTRVGESNTPGGRESDNSGQ